MFENIIFDKLIILYLKYELSKDEKVWNKIIELEQKL